MSAPVHITVESFGEHLSLSTPTCSFAEARLRVDSDGASRVAWVVCDFRIFDGAPRLSVRATEPGVFMGAPSEMEPGWLRDCLLIAGVRALLDHYGPDHPALAALSEAERAMAIPVGVAS